MSVSFDSLIDVPDINASIYARERLRILYDDRASLTLLASAHGKVTATIVVPVTS